jgi:hypothetical protein
MSLLIWILKSAQKEVKTKSFSNKLRDSQNALKVPRVFFSDGGEDP